MSFWGKIKFESVAQTKIEWWNQAKQFLFIEIAHTQCGAFNGQTK